MVQRRFRLRVTLLGASLATACGLLATGWAAWALAAGAALNSQKPIWEQTDALICTGLYRWVCGDGDCVRRVSRAEFRVDFKTDRIEYTTIPFGEDIINRRFIYYDTTVGSRHEISFGGWQMHFNIDAAVRDHSAEIDAVTVGYEWRDAKSADWFEQTNRSVETRFTCEAPR